jgi:hypothetical protein
MPPTGAHWRRAWTSDSIRRRRGASDELQMARWKEAERKAARNDEMGYAQALSEITGVVGYLHACSKREWGNIQGPRYHFYQDNEARSLLFTGRMETRLHHRCDQVKDRYDAARDMEQALLQLNLSDSRRRSVQAALNTALQRIARLPANCRGNGGFGPTL